VLFAAQACTPLPAEDMEPPLDFPTSMPLPPFETSTPPLAMATPPFALDAPPWPVAPPEGPTVRPEPAFEHATVAATSANNDPVAAQASLRDLIASLQACSSSRRKPVAAKISRFHVAFTFPSARNIRLWRARRE
jgi:hypothetical protein